MFLLSCLSTEQTITVEKFKPVFAEFLVRNDQYLSVFWNKIDYTVQDKNSCAVGVSLNQIAKNDSLWVCSYPF